MTQSSAEVRLQQEAKARVERQLAVHAETFQEAVSQLEEAYRAGLRAFVSWVAEAWQLDADAEWSEHTPPPASLQAAYRQGWAECLESLQGALDLFLDEYDRS